MDNHGCRAIRLLASAAMISLIPSSLVAAAALCEGVAPSRNTSLKAVQVVTGLAGSPLSVVAPPGDIDRIFIVEQDGFIRLHRRGDPPGVHSLFLDISARVSALGNEMGLLGLAFDPNYATNGYFYVDYTENVGGIRTIVARFSVDPGDPDSADAGSELRLLRISQPQTNHKGGDLEFGSDGMLFVSSGDGGGGGDNHGACGNGQSRTTLLGKILRIDPHAASPGAPDCGGTLNYSVPAGNPFADGPGGPCDEIWSYGLRNPWRIAIDPATDDLYIGDVGQNCWEEIDYSPGSSPGGENFGWRQMEGNQCFNPADFNECDPNGVSCGSSPPCGHPSLTLPIVEYGRAGGICAVIGGPVYRGCRMPAFDGAFFYGDFCGGFVKSFEVSNGAAINADDWTQEVDPGGTLVFSLTGFGTDGQGEIYVVDRDGSVLKILPPFPDLEVSGQGAGDPLLIEGVGGWTWEDLERSTSHPVAFYRVYRGVPGDAFTCVHATTDVGWPAGDAAVPAAGEVLAWIVTAVSPQGEESSSGEPARQLVSPCAAP